MSCHSRFQVIYPVALSSVLILMRFKHSSAAHYSISWREFSVLDVWVCPALFPPTPHPPMLQDNCFGYGSQPLNPLLGEQLATVDP